MQSQQLTDEANKRAPEEAETVLENPTPPKRQYPPLYEKIVPIALGMIAIVLIVLLLIIVGVALGLFPGTR